MHGLDLAFFARRPQALAASVRGHAQPANYRLNRIAVGQRPLQRFHDQADVALGHDQAVGIGVERARTLGAQRLSGREQHQRMRADLRRPAHDGHIGVAQLQRTGTNQHRLQRRCTGRIQSQPRAGQAKRLGDRAGHHAGAQLAAESRIWVFRLPQQRQAFGLNGLAISGRQVAQRVDFVEHAHRLGQVSKIGPVAELSAPATVTNKHGRIGAAHVERIFACLPQGVGRHSGHQQVRVVDRLLQLGRNGIALGVEITIGQQRC